MMKDYYNLDSLMPTNFIKYLCNKNKKKLKLYLMKCVFKFMIELRKKYLTRKQLINNWIQIIK
jgi:hypothetical protein